MSSDALDSFPKIIATSIIGAFTIAAILWHAFLNDMILEVLRQETAIERFLGLSSAVFLIGFAMASVMFPLILTHKKRMNKSFDGYEVDYSLRSFLPKKIIGRATVSEIRHDTGGLLGMSTSPRINARRDRIHKQRKNISCELCTKDYHDVYEPGSLTSDAVFTYIEEYKVYYLIIPFYRAHIETTGYCPHHRPEEFTPTS